MELPHRVSLIGLQNKKRVRNRIGRALLEQRRQVFKLFRGEIDLCDLKGTRRHD